LHETRVIDMYGSADERRHARMQDTDNHWWEVRDDWIEQFDGVGGLSFLDDLGFRYYLPAYMSYWLRTGNEPNCLGYFIAGSRRHRYRLFTDAQRQAIARFVQFVHQNL
jgi:hypothetical protein